MLIAALPFDISGAAGLFSTFTSMEVQYLCWWQAAGEAENLAPKITIFHKNRRKI
jgi:hypothetical protein